MKYIMQFALIILMSGLLLSCQKEESDIKKITGIISETGITTYQYGSHTISSDDGRFALRSSLVNLNDFVGEEKTIVGKLIDGYPVDGGPEFIEVEEIK